jgi:hypothetical protein
MWNEARVAQARVNSQMASDAVLMQLVGASMFTKEGGQLLQKTLRRLTHGE